MRELKSVETKAVSGGMNKSDFVNAVADAPPPPPPPPPPSVN